MTGQPDVAGWWFKNVSVDMKKAILFGIYFMIEFLTVSSVNADNRKRDVFPVLVVKVWEAPKRTSHGDIIFTQVR